MVGLRTQEERQCLEKEKDVEKITPLRRIIEDEIGWYPGIKSKGKQIEAFILNNRNNILAALITEVSKDSDI